MLALVVQVFGHFAVPNLCSKVIIVVRVLIAAVIRVLTVFLAVFDLQRLVFIIT